jgi:splicing factor 3A subunit 2
MAGWREHGSKPGGGGVADTSISNVDRRERLRQLALELIDLKKDPYILRNHLGSYECKLCLTLHNNEGSYLAHTQGRRHQMNLARRVAREQRDINGTGNGGVGMISQPQNPEQQIIPKMPKIHKKRIINRIGNPGYRVLRQRGEEGQLILTFTIEYPNIGEGIKPRYRFMSAFEQKVELPDKNYQYILFAADPYDTIAFKIPNKDIEKAVGPEIPGETKFWTKWDEEAKQFELQLQYKPEQKPKEPKKQAPRKEESQRTNYPYFKR